MQITIRISTVESFTIEVEENTSLIQLKEVIQTECPSEIKLPSNFKLIYNGVKIEDKVEVSDNTSIILMSDEEIIKKKKKKNTCSFKECGQTPLRMVGVCSHCSGKFCGKHRLLEDHLCEGLQFSRDVAHNRNATKLHSESTIVNRV